MGAIEKVTVIVDKVIGIVKVRHFETTPTDTSKKNPSAALTWTSGELTSIVLTIGAVTYTKTLVWSSGELQSISAWS